MPSSTPPTSYDVNAQLAAAGETVGAVDTERILAAVVAEWSRKAGWAPFQATGDSDTRYFDFPRNDELLLPGYAQIDSVRLGITYDQTTGVASSGTAAVRHAGYWPVFWKEGDECTPVMALQFCGYSWGYACPGRRSVAITGKVGYSIELPDDVWQAWVDGAAHRAMASTQITRTKGISKMTIGGRTIEFADGLPVTWQQSFDSSINNYRRGGVA